MFYLPHELIEEINNSSVLQAALRHRSAKSNAAELLSQSNQPIETLEAWESLGMAVIMLHAARISFDNATSAASASLLMQTIKPTLLSRISSALLSSKLCHFGGGATAAEIADTGAYEDMSARLVGGIAHAQGLSAVISKLLEPISCETGFLIEAKKDSKTQLQELYQGKRLELPAYKCLFQIPSG